MPYKLSSLTVVLVAHDVNLSIFRSSWLSRHGIIPEHELLPESIFSPAIVQARTKAIALDVLPNRIQVAPALPLSDGGTQAVSVAQQIVSLLPHTPYSAVGFNMHYVAAAPHNDFAQWNRASFSAQFGHNFTNEENARFGNYFSFDWEPFRIKVDAKPIHFTGTTEKSPEAMQVAINFHRDVDPERAHPQISATLPFWKESLEKADAITRALYATTGIES